MKKTEKMQHREEISENVVSKSPDTNTDVTNRTFTMGESIVKHVKAYEVSRKVQNCKVFVKGFSVDVYRGLRTTITERKTHSFHFPCWSK